MSGNASQKLIIWDWEGTIVDSRLVLWQALNAGLTSLAIPLIDINVWYRLLPQHRRLDTLLDALIPNVEYEDYTYLLSVCEQKMNTSAPPPLIPGMQGILTSLKEMHCILAVASNKESTSLRQDIERTGLLDDFSLCLGPGRYQPKPAPDMLEAIVASFGIQPENTLMVGDSAADMEAAKNARISAIGLDYSNEQKALLLQSGALAVIDSPNVLLSAIKTHLTKIDKEIAYGNDNEPT